MTDAMIGLIGVAIGALLTGGATYVLTRRTEKRAGRAATRILEDDLRRIEVALSKYVEAVRRERRAPVDESENHPLSGWQSTFRASRSISLRDVLGKERVIEAWLEHRDRLAEVLDTDDWDDISQTYVWIEQARANSSRPDQELTEHWATAGLDRVRKGLRVVERLARRE